MQQDVGMELEQFPEDKTEKDLEKQRAAKAARELDAHQREADKDQE